MQVLIVKIYTVRSGRVAAAIDLAVGGSSLPAGDDAS